MNKPRIAWIDVGCRDLDHISREKDFGRWLQHLDCVDIGILTIEDARALDRFTTYPAVPSSSRRLVETLKIKGGGRYDQGLTDFFIKHEIHVESLIVNADLADFESVDISLLGCSRVKIKTKRNEWMSYGPKKYGILRHVTDIDVDVYHSNVIPYLIRNIDDMPSLKKIHFHSIFRIDFLTCFSSFSDFFAAIAKRKIIMSVGGKLIMDQKATPMCRMAVREGVDWEVEPAGSMKQMVDDGELWDLCRSILNYKMGRLHTLPENLRDYPAIAMFFFS